MTGISEGSHTEVISPELTEGMKVVVGELESDDDVVVSNPFVPKMPGAKKSSDAQRN
jgi:hypothetical protein